MFRAYCLYMQRRCRVRCVKNFNVCMKTIEITMNRIQNPSDGVSGFLQFNSNFVDAQNIIEIP